MAIGDLVTADWMLEFNGLQFGGTSPYNLLSITGLASQPGLTTSDRERLGRHGTLPGDDYLVGRSVIVELEAHATASVTFQTAMQNLLTALAPGGVEVPMVFQVPGLANGLKARIDVRPRKRDVGVTRGYYSQMAKVIVEFYATDPRIYANDAQTSYTNLPIAGGGWTFNSTFNLSFGALSSGGQITAVNSGSFSTPLAFRIDGPCVNPRVENSTTGQSWGADITLASGEYLIVDTDTRSVLLNGTASRYSTLASTSTWWDLPVGTSFINFRAGTSTSATISLTWRSAWV